MCGIAGIFSEIELPSDDKLIRKMCDSIVHRGPDDEGYYKDNLCVLGMRRLSIIDLATGHQPVHNEDKTVWTVYNGEIYNYRFLRRELEGLGHRFYTKSDTEIIVHAYEEYGINFVNRLNGMFSIAIYDIKNRRLQLVRDRLGIKQLYYTNINNKLYFGSEIKTLLEIPGRTKSIDRASMDIYLTLLYIPAPMTIYDGIYALKPGHMMIIEDQKIMEQAPYWRLITSPVPDMTEEDAIKGFRQHFEKAVERRMISDVPLGAFLSGGIDSSAIVAVMSKFSDQPVKTFSIGYGGGENYYDERSFARIVSKLYKTEHRELIVTPDAKGIIPEIVRAFDQPFADSSAIPNYYINQMTRKYVKVALSGLGGDELAAGYERYLGVKLAGLYRKIPRWVREKLIEKIVVQIPDSVKGRRFVDRVKRFVRSGSLPVDQQYYQLISSFTEDQRRQLYANSSESISDLTGSWEYISEYLNGTCALDELTRILCLDINTYLVDDLLTLTDRMSMLHSLEVRVPFLDHELVEFCFSIPSKYKLRGINKKYLLKKAFSDLLPGRILHRSKKGFSVPLVLWFRNSLSGYLQKVLSPEVNNRIGFFNQGVIDQLINEHMQGKNNHHSRLWALIIFNEWYNANIEPVL